MKQSMLVCALGVAALMIAPVAQADDSGWQVRARAVYLDFDNSQSDGLPLAGDTKVEAESRWIPEVDVSYFFTKNIAAELVLTYPQTIDIKVGGNKQGEIKALPPSLLVQYHYTELGAFQPYAGVGLNYTIFSDRKNILDGQAEVDSSSIGLVGQLGFDYMINKNWGVNLDVKYIQMDTDVKVGGSKLGNVGLDPWTFGIGATYRF